MVPNMFLVALVALAHMSSADAWSTGQFRNRVNSVRANRAGNAGSPGINSEGDEAQGIGSGNPSSTTSVGFGERTTGTLSTSIMCTSHTFTATASRAQSAVAVAIANAFKSTCDPTFKTTGHMEEVVETLHEQWAYAVAESISAVGVACMGSQGTSGCALASSYANSYASSHIAGFASAAALAVDDYCSCESNAEVVQDAIAEADAILTADLEAETFTEAGAVACSLGEATSEAEAWQECYADATARIVAKAVALVLLGGNCDDGVEQKAGVLAEMSAYTTEYQVCDGNDSASGQFAAGGGSGGAVSGSFDTTANKPGIHR